MPAPIVVKPIPDQIVNERAAYGPFDLKEFIQSPDGSPVRFSAQVTDGQSLPKGMICTSDGILTGIPGQNTQGIYELSVTAENDAGAVTETIVLTIKPSLATTGADSEYVDKLKSQVWEALGQNLPVPEMSELYDRPVTVFDVYYMLERWGVLTIWDAFNLDPAGPCVPIQLEGMSKHYNVYDRGSSLVASPKDLYSHERTLLDSLMTAKAMAREVYKRGWTIEFAGFEKMMRAAWLELQLLGDIHGRQLEILHFDPTFKEIRLYNEQAKEIAANKYDQMS